VTTSNHSAVRLAEFTSSLAFADIPSEVVTAAKVGVLDLVGVALYGSTTEWAQIVREYVSDRHAPASTGSLIWGSALLTDPAAAAMANGTSAHSAELDDLHKASFYHPSAAVIPAALAIADVGNAVTGEDLLTSIIAGYEVGARVGMALGQGHFLRGYHPQGSVGVFAAAAAAARQRHLDSGQTLHALGIAGTQASGLMAAQEGAMVKRFHAGLACETGVRAVLLAERGFTGIEDVFEADFGGLLSTMGSPDSDAALLTRGLGTVWETAALEFKLHAACAAIHSALDVMAQLDLPSPDDVESVTVRTTTHSYLHCGFDYEPVSATMAQMSYQYCVAAMLTYGRVSIEQFDDALIADPALVALARKVRVEPDEAMDARGAAQRHAVEVTVRSASGDVVSGRRDARRGGVGDQFTLDELLGKFHELVGRAGSADAERLAQLVLDLDRCADVRELSGLLRAGPAKAVQS
jgi:aconitate decarboxylase